MHWSNLDWIIILLFIREKFICRRKEKLLDNPHDSVWDKIRDNYLNKFHPRDSQC